MLTLNYFLVNDTFTLLRYAGLYGAIVVYRPGTLSNKEIVTTAFGTAFMYSKYLAIPLTHFSFM